ncbi:hypothetical protein COCON_G00147460 [Conger conger]|uniref:TNFR-Cys domain-containing protein n=1 Tax=Conger conger TaxID=82655 RepID=A0A9Q1DC04_CONCO|nr:hypothetical protein COCON_G00147460 [Conger conger]
MKTLLIIFLAALAFAPFDGSELLIVSTYQWTDDVTGFPVTCDKCPPGTHVVKHCTKDRKTHRACPPGQGANMTGTAYTDVKCVKCEEGYFSSEYSTINQCQKHSQCKDGERTIPSNDKWDTFCTLCKINSSGLPSSPEDQAVCDRAVMDYVSQYPLHQKKHKRLENAVRRMAKEKDKNVPLIDMFLTIQKSRALATGKSMKQAPKC